MKKKREVTFECTRCGYCCKAMRGSMLGQLHGLMILPEERLLFPKKIIKPMFRYMMNYIELPGFVWMYQVDADVCPHYNGEGCKIYRNRPVTCQAFPFEPKGRGLAIHEVCPEIQRLLKEGYTVKQMVCPESYMMPLVKIQMHYNRWLVTRLIERFDLESQSWKYMTDGLTEKHKKDLGWK